MLQVPVDASHLLQDDESPGRRSPTQQEIQELLNQAVSC